MFGLKAGDFDPFAAAGFTGYYSDGAFGDVVVGGDEGDDQLVSAPFFGNRFAPHFDNLPLFDRIFVRPCDNLNFDDHEGEYAPI